MSYARNQRKKSKVGSDDDGEAKKGKDVNRKMESEEIEKLNAQVSDLASEYKDAIAGRLPTGECNPSLPPSWFNDDAGRNAFVVLVFDGPARRMEWFEHFQIRAQSIYFDARDFKQRMLCHVSRDCLVREIHDQKWRTELMQPCQPGHVRVIFNLDGGIKSVITQIDVGLPGEAPTFVQERVGAA